MSNRVHFQLTPTAQPHLQTLYIALYSWVYSRMLDGDFVLSVADDALGNQATTETSLAALRWLSINWDEGPEADGELGSTFQSSRVQRYQTVAAQLEQTHPDLVAIILDENGRFHPAFLTAVDQHDWQITHVVQDAPDYPAQQAKLLTALGGKPPEVLLIPALQTPEKRPLSTATSYFLHNTQNAGILPKALFHYLLELAWQPEEAFPILDKWLVRKHFKPEQLKTAPAQFEWAQLRAINQRYLQALSTEALAEEIRPFLEDAYGSLPMASGWLEKLTAMIKPQLTTLEDAIDYAEWAFSDAFEWSDEAETAVSTPQAHLILTQLIAELATIVLLDEPTAHTILAGLQRQHQIDSDQLSTIILSALIGQTNSLPTATIMGILGKQNSMQRIGRILRS